MAKSAPQPDVLVLGDHPCAYLAASLLRQAGSLRVEHSLIPGERMVDRLVTINPAFFELHELLSPLKRKLTLTPIYGLKFLADDPTISSMSVGKSITAYIGCYKQIHSLLRKQAEANEVHLRNPKELEITGADEKGLEVRIDGARIHPKLLILAGELPAEQKRLIGLPPKWEGQVMQDYTFLRLKGARWHTPGNRPIMPMSLDLGKTLNWAWLLPGVDQIQLALVRPAGDAETSGNSESLLRHWLEVLVSHGHLKGPAAAIDTSSAVTLQLPLGGALSQEGLANRTLLIGPAGGFYSACAEDIYPNCWSAIHACDVAKRGLKEKHVQDAIQPYRQRWGATLGDYLRGPQQNLRYLLPLVYRNPTMTARLAEAILSGKSVVR